jgi:hypothetical protein
MFREAFRVRPDPHYSQGMDYIAAARAAWQAWAGEIDRQRAGRDRSRRRVARIRSHSDRELQKFAACGQAWAIAELQRRGLGATHV